mmetsp:Transcript_41/g.92  ORF Transcript_41/g.92 Transcript_41/m.92 type:complete len:223 (-) Transcript_41:46-714(-)
MMPAKIKINAKKTQLMKKTRIRKLERNIQCNEPANRSFGLMSDNPFVPSTAPLQPNHPARFRLGASNRYCGGRYSSTSFLASPSLADLFEKNFLNCSFTRSRCDIARTSWLLLINNEARRELFKFSVEAFRVANEDLCLGLMSELSSLLDSSPPSPCGTRPLIPNRDFFLLYWLQKLEASNFEGRLGCSLWNCRYRRYCCCLSRLEDRCKDLFSRAMDLRMS